jgi:hypothetical protein
MRLLLRLAPRLGLRRLLRRGHHLGRHRLRRLLRLRRRRQRRRRRRRDCGRALNLSAHAAAPAAAPLRAPQHAGLHGTLLRAPTSVLYVACDRKTSLTVASHVTEKKPLLSSKAVTTPSKPTHFTRQPMGYSRGGQSGTPGPCALRVPPPRPRHAAQL